MNIFIAFANQDRDVRDCLLSQMNLVKDRLGWHIWSAKEIKAGERWDEEIKRRLMDSEVVILLLSTDFFNSKYIIETELPKVVEKHRLGNCQIIPIVVRACHWKETPLGEYVTMGDIQALPEGELVLKEMANEDRAYFDAVQSIRTSIQSWEVKKQAEQDAKNSTPSKLLLPEFDSPQKMETKSPKKPVFSAEIKIPDELKRYLPEMILVKGGTATLGEAGKNYDTKFTPYTAELQDFYIGKYPITFEQYDYYCKDVEKTEPYFYAPNRPRGKLPVVNVSWKEANKYCRWLSEKTSLNFRLPYESEWEFAARGGLKSKGFKYAGSNNLDEVGWFWENSGDKPMYGKWKAGKTTENNCRPHPVGLKKPNELGIYDMSGNVWEWCDGTYGYFDYRDKVKRGGSCAHTAEFSEVTFRSSGRDKWGASDGGFRVVRVI